MSTDNAGANSRLTRCPHLSVCAHCTKATCWLERDVPLRDFIAAQPKQGEKPWWTKP